MTEPSRRARVLLIGWDAADWKFIHPLLDDGKMPHLARLVEGGAIGNLATLQPCLSPILWTSIATGKTADKHGIAGFVEPIPGGGGVRPSTSTSRTTKAVWNILSQSGLHSVVVNWYASHPAEPIRGVCVSNRFFEGPADAAAEWPAPPGSVHPGPLAADLADLRMHPSEIGPGQLACFIPELGLINRAVDRRPDRLAEVIARTVSVHSVATALMETEPWDFLAVYYDGLDVAGHQFMPFHPPRMPTVSASDFRLYQHVMRELYLFHDAMLGRLLELAGPDATALLVSDHGFHSDHLRPSRPGESEEALAALWHRQYGVLAVAGPGVIADERVYGATLLDITPTVLSVFGLPVGQDMAGRPLVQAFDPPLPVRSLPTWDAVPGEAGLHPADLQRTMTESVAAVEQLIALGYLPPATAEADRAVALARAEAKFNLAIVHSAHGRAKASAELLEELRDEWPDEPRYAVALAKQYANLGRHADSLALVDSLEARGWRSPEGDLLVAGALFHQGEADRADERLARCERDYPPSPAVFSMMGHMHLARKRWVDAAAAFDRALALDDDNPQAHDGAARAALATARFDLAAEHALRAVSLVYFFPQAHYHLGMAYRGLGDRDRAVRSLETAVAQAPHFAEAKHQLDQLRA